MIGGTASKADIDHVSHIEAKKETALVAISDIPGPAINVRFRG
jgi:hypothetical protein